MQIFTATRPSLPQASALRVIGFVVGLYLAAAAAVWGTTAPLDEQMRLLRDKARSHEASGKVAIVEIDARSLRAVSDWPWPRRNHAGLIDQLRKAGATMIAFDVDVSARSNAADDQLLADALRRADGAVILPTFRQQVSQGSGGFSENMPIAQLRESAFLGSVNVQADADGQLRSYSYGTVTAGVPRPSIAALLADAKGTIGTNFRVDTAIDPASIPRLSAIDVLHGKAGLARNRAVIVGATAIEMGDRYVVPGHGVLPGVVVQALAAETLIQGRTNPDWGPWPALFLTAAILIAGIRLRSQHRYWHMFAAAAVMVVALPLIFEMACIASFQVAPAILLLTIDAALTGLLHLRRKLLESRMSDPLTGLPNARALARSCRHSERVAVTAVRVPQFDELAAVLDGSERAQLMAQIVNRLLVAFPSAHIHAVAAGILAWTSNDTVTSDDAESAGALFRAPVALASRAILVSPVFGISEGAGDDAEHLLARASIAAREAHAAGRRWAMESRTLSRDADRSIAIIADVSSALANRDIYPVFQAKWDVGQGRICGAEALARWTHPQFGNLSPDEFVPILEQNGQMKLFTLAIVDMCLDQLQIWHATDQILGLAINISAALLDDRDFVKQVSIKLDRLSTLANFVTLEVTESATIASTETAVAALTKFRALGARVSIDDYGTGQATLTYLKSFPADEIKIDKGFVTHLLSSNSDQIVVRSTIELAHELGFQVVAEGVEDADCLALLTRYGCDTIQGWVIGKPMRADAFVEAIKLREAA